MGGLFTRDENDYLCLQVNGKCFKDTRFTAGSDAGENGFYYVLFQKASWWLLGLPPSTAILIFAIIYYYAYLRHTARIRTKMLIKIQTNWLQRIVVAFMVFFVLTEIYGLSSF